MANTLNAFRNGDIGFIDWLGFSELNRLFPVELKDHKITMSEPRWVVLSCDPEARLLKRALGVDVVDPKSLGFTAGNKKTWRVFTAISALPDRNTFVRLSKTNVAKIQTLKTQQLKVKRL